MQSYLNMVNNGSAPETLIGVLDDSHSMELGDWPPSRLLAAKEAMCALIAEKAERYPEDRIGVVRFASSAKVAHVPVAAGVARGSLVAAVASLRTHSMTNIGSGLSAAGGLLEVSPAPGSRLLRRAARWLTAVEEEEKEKQAPVSRRILLLTDGDSNSGPDPVVVAERLKSAGIIIDVIGIASRESVNEPVLKNIASKRPDGSPRYCFIGDRESLIREFRRQAGQLREYQPQT